MKRLSKITDGLIGQPMFKLLVKVKEMEERGARIFHFEIGDSVDYNDIRICNDSLVVTMYDVDKDNEADYVSFWPYPSNRNFTSRDSVRINRLSGEKTYKSLYKAAHEAVQKEMRRRQQNK